MDEWNISKRKSEKTPKVRLNNDISRHKEKKHQKKIVDDDFDDAEILRIQGLIRCKVCESPYPMFLELCPVCK